MRTFLSYDINEPELLSRIANFQKELLKTGSDLKLVRPDILHFTVRFFGELEQDQVERIITTLSGKVEDFELIANFAGVGVFPSEKRISVIWVGVDKEAGANLSRQVTKVNELISSLKDLPKEDDRFTPHVTIARVRSARNKDALLSFLNSNRTLDFGSVTIKRLKLKLSELGPSGPSYSDLHVF